VTARNNTVPGERVAAWRARIATEDERVAECAARLSRLLLAPSRALLAGRRLVIAADGSLQHVPFAVLSDPSDQHRRAPRPLIVGHEIVVLPSASAATLLRRRAATRAEPPKTIAVFADPVFDAADPRVPRASVRAAVGRRGSEPSAEMPPADTPTGVTRSADTPDGRPEFLRLPYTRIEADAILALVPPARRTRAIDFDASLAAILDPALARHRILHIASHARLESAHPQLSAIALSTVDQAGRPIDGLLRLHHVYALDLPVDLVVLSACETALGEDLRGEGLASLARGFLYAGARGVLGSLWRVDDEGTTALMVAFYRGMLGPRHLAPAAALRQAQLALWRDPRWRAPFFWSGFLLQGDWR
jgi:CHAT domain-containing protein